MSRQNAVPEADAAAEDTAAPARWPATGSGPVSATPAANAAGWNSSDVTVDWNRSDTGAGLDPAICTQQTTSSGEGTLDLSASCTDLAGNTVAATYTVKVVLTDPTVTITVPQDGTQHQVGQNVVADFSCADAVPNHVSRVRSYAKIHACMRPATNAAMSRSYRCSIRLCNPVKNSTLARRGSLSASISLVNVCKDFNSQSPLWPCGRRPPFGANVKVVPVTRTRRLKELQSSHRGVADERV
jgi:hypothetical protein